MTTRARGYEPMDPISVRQAEQWFASGDPRKILRALLRLSLHGPDFACAEGKALEYADYPDVWVRRNVATALSHISRVHGSIDLDAVMMTLVKFLDDPEVVDWADFALDDNVWLEATHGHTPGHVAVHLQSGQHRAVLCGDLIHSPLQCHYPQWRYWIDSDAQQAIATRERFLQEQCEQRRVVLTAHFPRSSFGYVEAEQDAFRFRFLDW